MSGQLNDPREYEVECLIMEQDYLALGTLFLKKCGWWLMLRDSEGRERDFDSV